jgi:hypothetical protein
MVFKVEVVVVIHARISHQSLDFEISFDISMFLEGAPTTEEPRPDASNARSQRPATRAIGVTRALACVLKHPWLPTGVLHCPGHPSCAGA